MSSTATKRSAFQRFWELDWKLKILVVVIIPIAVFVTLLLLLNSFNYAVGERTGVISKLSQKGIACWTWEGQLAQPNFSRSSALGSGGLAGRQHLRFLRAGSRGSQAAREHPAGQLGFAAI